ncbi:tetratricopeptide repeat protein [Nonomuraea salmonea]|jgi:TPR repeat protein|uniref:Tetratricopeptide repeat protein n=1 Tax=Nonomuraea salmonea TaxID=46181 RepID=A0ABV5NPD6_9ACTN
MANRSGSDLFELAEQLHEALVRGDAAAGKQLMRMLPQLEEIASEGRADVQALVAGLYLERLREPEKAYRLFVASAKAGHPAGQRGLGSMLANGIGVERDLDAARELFESAALSGDLFALFNLAMMYLQGAGVEQDEVKGQEFLRRAADEGLPAANAVLGDQFAAQQDFAQARVHYGVAASGGVSRVIYTLAEWYRDGVGGPVDKVQAVRWFLKLLDFGDGDGVHGAISLARSMSDQEIRMAAQLVDRSAEAEALIRVARK